MKKLVLLTMLLVCSVVLFGQMGFFSLSYGDSFKYANGVLTSAELGFKLIETDESAYIYTSDKFPDIDQVVLQFDPSDDELITWQIFYNAYSDEEFDAIYEKVYAMHGEEIYWDEDFYCDAIKLGNNKFVHIGLNWDDWFVVDYYNDEYPQFSEF